MTRFQSFFAHGALLLGVIAFATSFARPTSGQQGTTTPTGEGRYRVAAAGAGNPDVFVTDSVTGHT